MPVGPARRARAPPPGRRGAVETALRALLSGGGLLSFTVVQGQRYISGLLVSLVVHMHHVSPIATIWLQPPCSLETARPRFTLNYMLPNSEMTCQAAVGGHLRSIGRLRVPTTILKSDLHLVPTSPPSSAFLLLLLPFLCGPLPLLSGNGGVPQESMLVPTLHLLCTESHLPNSPKCHL